MSAAIDLTTVALLACTLDRRALALALTRLKYAAGRHAALRVLEHVLLRAADGVLTLTATDLAVVVQATLPAADLTPGELLVPLARLVAVVRPGRGTVALAGDQLTMAGATYTLPALDPATFPAIQAVPVGAPDTTLPRAVLARMVHTTAYAMSTDTTRPHLCGARLERADGVLRMVTTDGHRLAVARTPDAGADFAVIVTRRGVEELARMVAGPGHHVRIHRAADRIWFVAGGDVVSAKLVDASFPAWEQVVPGTGAGTLTMRPTDLLGALKAITGRTTDGVTLTPNLARNAVEVGTDDGDGSSARVLIHGVISGEVPARLGFNARYLRELLEALGEDDYGVTFEVSGDVDPVKVVGADGAVYVLMPMRV